MAAQWAGATRQSQSGFTFTEAVIAGFMIIATMAITTRLMIQPVQGSSTLTPRAIAMQRALYVQQDQAEQIALAAVGTPPSFPTPAPTANTTTPALSVTVFDEMAVATTPTSATALSLYTCGTISPGNNVWIVNGASSQTVTVSAVTPGTVTTSNPAPPCTVTVSAMANFSAHTRGTPVVPVTTKTVSGVTQDIYQRYVAVAATHPRLGSNLVSDASAGATQVVVYDTSDFSVGSLVRIHSREDQSVATDDRRFYTVTAITGTTLTLNSGLAVAVKTNAVVAVGTQPTSAILPTAGQRCLTVASIGLFRAVGSATAAQGMQIDSGTTMESGIVGCTGTGCTCDNGVIATAATVALIRPLRNTYTTSARVFPSIVSVSNVGIVRTASGQNLGG